MRGSSCGRGFLAQMVLAMTYSCAIFAGQQGPAQAPRVAGGNGAFRVAGVVVSLTSGSVLPGTRVSLTDTKNPRNTQWMVTGDDGRFAFNGLSAGKYSLLGGHRGFIRTTYDQHGQFSTAIVTGAGVDTENLTLRLVPMATISGTVLDEFGEGVREANVRLYRENHGLGITQIVSAGGTSADDQGFYEFVDLIPGNYFVSASGRPWYAVHPPRESEGGQFVAVDRSLDVSYPTTYYSGTTDADVATPIPIKGGEQAEIDLNLAPVPSLHLIFHVPENQQNGFIPPMLEKRALDSSEAVGYDGMQLISGGTYELTGVPAGKYTVRFRQSPSGELGRTTEVEVKEDGQELDASPGEPLSGLKLSVKIAGEDKLPERLFVALRDARVRTVAFQWVDANGDARFEGVTPGKYVVVAGSQTKRYSVIRVSLQNGSETAGNEVSLTPGSEVAASIVLISGTGSIEGFVKRSGEAAAGMMVVLVPEDPESNVDLFRRDQSDLDGSFVFRGVVPGNYTVIAIEDGWTLDWSRPAVLARYAPHGERLKMPAEARDSIHLLEPVEVQMR
jgi:Carboxypeptidase regulatory-like domain